MKSNKPKIAQVVCTYPPYRGGMGRIAFEYTERLRERGYNVHVFTTRQSQDIEDPKYVHRLPALQIGNAGVMPSLYRRLSGFDIVHLHYPFFGGAEPVVVRKAISKNQGLVMTYHMDAVASGLRGAIFNAHTRVMFPWIINRVDRVLASSRDYIENSFVSEVAGAMDRVEIHPFGVDLERFSPNNKVTLKKDLYIESDVPVIIFVGGLDKAHHFKGVSVLIDAVDNLKEQKWHLVIVGDGDLKQTYQEQVKEKKLDQQITFAGNVSDDDLPRYYQMADFHVFPSTRRAEAFGLVAAEAAASGIPTIASNLPGVRTVVQDGVTGLLIEQENISELSKSISLFLERPDLVERFGHAARLHADTTFAWDPLITNLENTYDSVLNQQSKREYN